MYECEEIDIESITLVNQIILILYFLLNSLFFNPKNLKFILIPFNY